MNRKYLRIVWAIAAMVASNTFSMSSELESIQPIGAMGKGARVLGGGKEAVLFEHQGTGCLTHFWFGGNFKGVENTRIRYYVDGEETASIDMELYMGHGIGFNDNHAPWATKHVGKIGKRNGIYNNYRIPFGKSMRVTAQRAPRMRRRIRRSGGSSAAWKTGVPASAEWNCRKRAAEADPPGES